MCAVLAYCERRPRHEAYIAPRKLYIALQWACYLAIQCARRRPLQAFSIAL